MSLNGYRNLKLSGTIRKVNDKGVNLSCRITMGIQRGEPTKLRVCQTLPCFYNSEQIYDYLAISGTNCLENIFLGIFKPESCEMPSCISGVGA